MKKRLRVIGRPWVLIPFLVVVCWGLTFLGLFSLLIFPVLSLGSVVSVRRKAWVALVVLLTVNPLVVYYAGGVIDYFTGAPRLYFLGLSGMESQNLDRSSRCYHRSVGCVVDGDEWTYIWPHNAAVRHMARLFGPPSQSYDGPYPTKEEAQALVTGAKPTPVSVFLKGQVYADDQIIELQVDVATELLGMRRMHLLQNPQEGGYEVIIRAKLYKERCLILLLTEISDYLENDMLILLDNRTKKAFAHFSIPGYRTHIPPVSHSPE